MHLLFLLNFNCLITEKLVLQCPKLESVHAIGCEDVLIEAVQTQVNYPLCLFYKK